MSIVRGSTIEAFNAYLGGLKADPEGIEFTFLQFDTGSLDKLCVAQPVASVADLSLATYQPRGGTPLIDAAYKTIKAVEAAIGTDTPKVVICIQTDGEENSSTEHTWEALSALVREKTELGWQFNFMGAGIDAYAQGAKMGIAAMATMAYDHHDKKATREAFAANARNTVLYASGAVDSTNYSAAQRISAGDRWASLDLTGKPNAPVGRTTLTPGIGKRPALDLTTPVATGSAGNDRKKTIPDITL